MSNQIAWDYLAAFVTIAALAIGLISMAVGRISTWRESDDWPDIERRPPAAHRVMSRPRLVRRRAEPVRWTREPPEPAPVRAHQNQLEPTEPGETGTPCEPLQLNRLSRTAEIALLAVQRNGDGAYRHSANDITRLMGGTAADVKKQIAEIRALPPEEPTRPAARADRPSRGWPKTA